MQHMIPRQTHEFLQANSDAVFIDVRSEVEYLFVGHPIGALLIPWYNSPDWEINPHFVAEVKMAASINRPVVLICRSGKRSEEAGLALEKAGIQEVHNVLHGFEGDLNDQHHRSAVNGWRFDELPWEQC